MNTPNDTGREIFIAGLRNAHAVENQAVSPIKRQLAASRITPKWRAGCDSICRKPTRKSKGWTTFSGLTESNSTLKDAGGTLIGTWRHWDVCPGRDPEKQLREFRL